MMPMLHMCQIDIYLISICHHGSSCYYNSLHPTFYGVCDFHASGVEPSGSAMPCMVKACGMRTEFKVTGSGRCLKYIFSPLPADPTQLSLNIVHGFQLMFAAVQLRWTPLARFCCTRYIRELVTVIR
jgi:hypothetical protein